MELKIGDVVRLNSDVNVVNLMTINAPSNWGDDYWQCVWFDGKEIKTNNFHYSALTIVK